MTQTAKKSPFSMNVDLMHGPIFKNLLLFMLPIFISSLFQQLYNTVDTMIVGNVLGDTALAAIGSCGSIYELLVGFGLGIGNGLAIVAARSYGAQDHDLLKKTVAGSLVIGLVASLCITLAGVLGLHPLLLMLDTPAEILDDAYRYILTIDLGVLVMFAYNLCAGLLRAIGNSVMPLVFLLISSGLNVVLDLLFIAGMGMGVQGAAVATVISQGVSVVLCILYIFLRVKILLPEKQHFRVGSHLYWELFSQSISMGLMSSIVSAGSVVLQYGINGLGTLVIAGQTVSRQRASLAGFPATARHKTPADRRSHRRPEAVLLYHHAGYGHGIGMLHVCFPELRCKPAGACPQGHEGDRPVQRGGGCAGDLSDAAGRGVDGAVHLRLRRVCGAGKRRTVSALERALLLGAGCPAGHPLRPAEPGAEGPAPLLQCH